MQRQKISRKAVETDLWQVQTCARPWWPAVSGAPCHRWTCERFASCEPCCLMLEDFRIGDKRRLSGLRNQRSRTYTSFKGQTQRQTPCRKRGGGTGVWLTAGTAARKCDCLSPSFVRPHLTMSHRCDTADVAMIWSSNVSCIPYQSRSRRATLR